MIILHDAPPNTPDDLHMLKFTGLSLDEAVAISKALNGRRLNGMSVEIHQDCCTFYIYTDARAGVNPENVNDPDLPQPDRSEL